MEKEIWATWGSLSYLSMDRNFFFWEGGSFPFLACLNTCLCLYLFFTSFWLFFSSPALPHPSPSSSYHQDQPPHPPLAEKKIKKTQNEHKNTIHVRIYTHSHSHTYIYIIYTQEIHRSLESTIELLGLRNYAAIRHNLCSFFFFLSFPFSFFLFS